MATWKEKGVVPDSDDEEDLDSQSIAYEHDLNNDERIDETHGLEDAAGDGNNRENESERETFHNSYEKSLEIDDIELPTLNHKIRAAGSLTPPVHNVNLTPSLLSSPRAFKVPQLFLELKEDAVPSDPEKGLATSRYSRNSSQSMDEISKSYVRITSATSSPLSSPPRSQLDLLSSTHSSGQLVTGPERRGDASNHPGAGGVELEEFGAQATAKRSLRHRNLNQLYPYQLELEKYKQELKGRGIAPTMIAESQEERCRIAKSPNPESQDFDSQDRHSEGDELETEQSQPMDLAWENPPSSVPMPAPEADDRDVINHGSLLSDEDDFPDIDELLRQPPAVLPRLSAKRRMKSYSTKFKRPLLSKIHTHSTSRVHQETESNFEIPASPPATSSPFSAPMGRQPMSRATSDSSKAPTPSRLAFDERSIRETRDLPTPATSATKPAPVFIYSDSDSEDLLAKNPDIRSGSESSSSDESLQLRRVGKKIRGVLPASHLRLDLQQKRPLAPRNLRRASLSMSPAKVLIRRGVALPRAPKDAEHPSLSSSTRFPFLEDESDEVDNETGPDASLMDLDTRSERESLFNQSRMGFAEEDDRIDAMLPARKRQTKMSSTYPRKKRRITSEPHKRQPKITEHLKTPRQSASHTEVSLHSNPKAPVARRKHARNPRRPRAPAAPRLGILDVTDFPSQGDLPQFIRIAVRTARTQRGQGRQSPTRKYIRLATREDTFDAQSVLQDWREGRIQPKNLDFSQGVVPHIPLRRIENNQQTRLRSPLRKARPAQHRPAGPSGISRKLVISKAAQRSMNDFVSSKEAPLEIQEHLPQNSINPIIHPRQRERPRYRAPPARPAQLESTDADYSCRYPAASFRSSKKVLDTLYRASRKRVAPQANLQLSRFLANEDVVLPSIEVPAEVGSNPEVVLVQRAELSTRIQQPKKRLPRRIDAGAAIYRQPSDPLILEFLVPSKIPNAETDGSKLLGLGKYGTNYPISFDIFPLQTGVFFHESTFIGSGQLSKSLHGDSCSQTHDPLSSTSLTLGTKQFCWGVWDENVSSEVGVCFDWILDQIFTPSPPASSPHTTLPVDVLGFVECYVQHYINFTEPLNLGNFLSRMIEVLQDFLSRLETYPAAVDLVQVHHHVVILERCTLLAFQILMLSRSAPEQTSLMIGLESLLQKAAGDCVGFLLSQGLEGIRKLYDDLQYLSFRERGIRSDQYIAQAWVTVMRVMDAARIPRGSFWDVANSQLMDTGVRNTDDARVVEKLWYSMFTLLPLSEFDEFGVVIPGTRHQAAFDNWALPQQMLRRVFALYGSNPRQSPSFNDYCRAIVSRCHYLMVEWGWWKCNRVIGTLFDFFASQNLAHLRNEEVYASPRFLEELHLDPSLAVEPEDRCFHIFLKIVAHSIKHLRQINDTRTIRNLVARLLPNHDRQYPKEEAIHQRDLASLRNHHDLLCTLFWAAPTQQRPSPFIIQELVAVDRSHKAACLINVRAWGNLARFVVTTSPTSEDFLPLTIWCKTLFNKLWQQYRSIETEVHTQAQSLALLANSNIATIVQDTIMANQRAVVEEISLLIRTVSDVTTIAANHSSKEVKLVSMASALIEALKHPPCKPLIPDVTYAIQNYLSALHATEDRSSPPSEDSQGSLCIDEYRWAALDEVKDIYLPAYSKALGNVLNGLVGLPNSNALANMVRCWAEMVAMVTTEPLCNMPLRDFLVSGDQAVFQNGFGLPDYEHLYALALSVLVDRASNLDAFFIRRLDTSERSMSQLVSSILEFDIGREWMVILTRAKTSATLESASKLGCSLRKKSHYLLRTDYSPELHMTLPAEISIHWALNRMRAIVQDQDDLSVAPSVNLSPKTVKAEFAITLKAIMESMRRELELLPLGSTYHGPYVSWVQGVIVDIRARVSHIQPVLEYFLYPSRQYWPPRDDPKLFSATILSYSLQLAGTDAKKVSSQLFHFLLNGLRQSLLEGQLEQHVGCIKKGVKNWQFLEFLLKEFLPVGIRVGFESYKWVLAWVYLPIIAKRVVKLLKKNDDTAASTFKCTANLLNWIRKGMYDKQSNLGNLNGVYPQLQGILASTISFYIAVQSAMAAYSKANEDTTRIMKEYQSSFRSFNNKVHVAISGLPGEREPLKDCSPEKGSHFEIFLPSLKAEMELWNIETFDTWVEIPPFGVRSEVKKVPLNREPLHKITANRNSPQPENKVGKFFGNLFG